LTKQGGSKLDSISSVDWKNVALSNKQNDGHNHQL